MGFLDELKRLTHPYEDEMEDDYDEEEDLYEDEDEDDDVPPPPRRFGRKPPAAGSISSRPVSRAPATRW